MAFKIKQDHLEVLISYMELHPEFATGHLSVVNAKDKFRQLWQELSSNLNSLGYGERPVDKWQKTWTDYKTNLKKKASEIKRYQQMTGGGPELEKKLSAFELRVLNLLGKTFIEGVGVKEIGFNAAQKGPNIPSKSPTTSYASQKELNFSPEGPSTSYTKLIDAATSTMVENVRDSPGDFAIHSQGLKRPYNYYKDDDHDYISQTTPPPQKRKSKLESIYYKSISKLTNIENILNNRLSNCNEQLSNISGELKDIKYVLTELNNTLKDCFDK